MAILSKERIAEIRQMLDIGSKDFEFMRDALVETLAAHDELVRAKEPPMAVLKLPKRILICGACKKRYDANGKPHKCRGMK